MTGSAVVDVRPLFRPLLGELLRLLAELSADQWQLPAVGTWRVRDVAAHLLDGDVRRLTFQRDRLPMPALARSIDSFGDLTAFLNDLNASWIAATQRIGPALLTDLLKLSGEQVANFFESLELSGPAFLPVSWAGQDASAAWLDLGREYTERWHHQQQIREAVGAAPLTASRWLSPVLRVAAFAIPRAYEPAVPDTPVEIGIEIRGEAGGTWALRFADGAWSISERPAPSPATRLSIDEDAAWRLLHKRLSPEQARVRLRVEGDPAWAEPLLTALAVMA